MGTKAIDPATLRGGAEQEIDHAGGVKSAELSPETRLPAPRYALWRSGLPFARGLAINPAALVAW